MSKKVSSGSESSQPPLNEPEAYKQILRHSLDIQDWIQKIPQKSAEDLALRSAQIQELRHRLSLIKNPQLEKDKEELLNTLNVLGNSLQERSSKIAPCSSGDFLTQIFLSERVGLPLFDNWVATVLYLNEENKPLLHVDGKSSPLAQKEHLDAIEKLLTSLEKEISPDLIEVLKKIDRCEKALEEDQQKLLSQEALLTGPKKLAWYETMCMKISNRCEVYSSQIMSSKELSKTLSGNLESRRALLAEIQKEGVSSDQAKTSFAQVEQEIQRYQSQLEEAATLQRQIKTLIANERPEFERCAKAAEELKSELASRKEDQEVISLYPFEEAVKNSEFQLAEAQQEMIRLLSPSQREKRFYKAALLAASSEVSAFVEKKLQEQLRKECEDSGIDPSSLVIKDRHVHIQRQEEELLVKIEMTFEASAQFHRTGFCTFTLQPLIGKCVPLDITFDFKSA